MADEAGEFRHLIEGLIAQQLDAAAAQRGWDLGAQAQGAQLSTAGAGLADPIPAFEFSTGYDGTVTIMLFTFGLSPLGGTDVLM